MTLLDANLLLYAHDQGSPQHEAARTWITERLNGPARVGLPWHSLVAFMRIATHHRIFDQPLSPQVASAQVASWLAAPAAWVPSPTDRHGEVLGQLIDRYELRGNMISDAHLAALALEHGLELCSTDTDFARFREIRWLNPID